MITIDPDTAEATPAIMRNRATGPLEGQLRERHDASDFETKRQDKIDGHGNPIAISIR
jgi:GSH-dependent disulfide-bond oxidoreductase